MITIRFLLHFLVNFPRKILNF